MKNFSQNMFKKEIINRKNKKKNSLDSKMYKLLQERATNSNLTTKIKINKFKKMRDLNILLVITLEMKNAPRIIVHALKGVFAKSIAFAITFCASFTSKVVIANQNARKNHALVMLMIENAIKTFVIVILCLKLFILLYN